MSNPTTTQTLQNNRYDLAQLNGKFVVTDRQVAGVCALTDQGTPADNSNPDHMIWFGMSYTLASGVADALNARYHG